MDNTGGIHFIISPLIALAQEQLQEIRLRDLVAVCIGSQVLQTDLDLIKGTQISSNL